jgi:hypothetical protein
MEKVGAFLFVSIFMGLALRLITRGKREKRKGLVTPARFIHFAGRRLRITTRID